MRIATTLSSRRFLLPALVLAILAVTMTAGNGQDLAKLPPLLDRELFFGDPKIAGAQISPDGSWISFIKPYRDIMNIWVKRVDEPFEAAKPITADTERPVRIYFWTEDSRYVLYIQDKGGNENFHIYAVDPRAEAEKDSGVPAARDLTPYENVRAMIYALPESAPREIIVGLNDRDAALHDAYRLNIDSGARELLITNDDNVAAWMTDSSGAVRLALRQTPDGGTELLTVKAGELGQPIYTCAFEETCSPVRFHKDDKRLYIETNKGEKIDLTRLGLLDVATGKSELVESDPENEVDFGGALFSDQTEELMATVYTGDRDRIYPKTAAAERDLAILREKLPDGDLRVASTTEDMRILVVAVSSDINPGSVYVYDRDKGSVTKLYDSRPELPSEHLATMKAVRYPGRDGTAIPAYLTLPKGLEPKNLPAVILPHGGPWARDNWGYDAFAQFLANRGYAVLQPNFRGSTGYGKAFLNAGNDEWGTGTMQHDISNGVKYLSSAGVADKKRIAIMGGSYGGYATLAGLAFTPDLYAAGVSIVGPSNIITLLNSIPPYWGPMKKMFTMRVGDPEIPEERERLIAQSPFYSAKKIQAPLLVIQGANDPRVKQAESDQIVVALRELGRPVEYLVAPDEGHGFAGRDNRLAMFAVIEEFLAKHLGGRYQKESPAPLAERIGKLRVDVNKVKMPEVPAGAEEAKTSALPLPAGELQPMKLSYDWEIVSAAGMKMAMKDTREIALDELDGVPVWRIAMSLQGPMGNVSQIYWVDKQTLLPRRVTAEQGPAKVEAEYSAEAVHGTIKLPGQEMKIDQKLPAPVLGEDAALEAYVAALPLAEGYRMTLRTFDLNAQKVRTWSLEVKAKETQETAAGTFATWKIALDPLDGEGGAIKLWILSDAPRRTVRSEVELPAAAGGGTLTTTLSQGSGG
ncbi:MAG: prolyl oligopeptidase family serine peptidase [Planctomycetota bacterium]